ncbi:MAG: hypothetical protein IJE84_02520, partial [Clostridia bacterium]|nr:hypothetical protein [Clostridia bacterium]
YVADRNGNVTPYSTVQEQGYSSGKTVKGTFQLQDFLPEEGWLVALQIYPCSDVAPAEVTEVKTTGNSRMLLNVAQANYKVTDMEDALPPVSEKPEGLYLEMGVVKGFDPDKSYAWAPFSLMGNKLAEYTALPEGTTEFSFDREGAVAIVYVGDGYTTAHSEPAYVALGGSANDILHVTLTNGDHKTVEVGGTKYKLYTIDDVQYYLKDSVYYLVSDNTAYTGENAANAQPVYNSTKEVPDVVALENNKENLLNVKFTEGKWSGLVLNNSLALNYGYDALVLGTTSTPIPNSLATALNTTDAAALATARKNAAEYADNIYYSYGFKPEEIIKMSDLESFKVRASKRQGGFNLSGKVQTKLVFKVIDPEGNLVDRVAYKNAVYDWNGTTHTFVPADFEETDGYIVGIVVYPYVLTEGSYYTYASKTNGDYNIYLFTDGYKVNRTLEPADQPDVVFEDGKIKGLDADKTYYYGGYAITGKLGEWTEVTGVTEVTHGITGGLVGISVEGDGKWTSESKPVIGYVEGDVAGRAAIGNMNPEDTAKPIYNTSQYWTLGTWTGDYLSWYDQ